MSSPRSWGCFYIWLLLMNTVEVFPTLVGVFLFYRLHRGNAHGLPHARGGVSDRSPPARSPAPSSPRSWGCFYIGMRGAITSAVFPTLVGVFLEFSP